MIVRLSAAAAATISLEAPTSADGRETGGILLGHDLGEMLVVRVAGDPGPAAIREPQQFLRDLAHAQALSDNAYDADGSVWLGEWHTHPDGPAEPSPTDLTTYIKLLGNEELAFTRILSLIATPCGTYGWSEVHLTAWVVNAAGARQVQVESDRR